MKTIEKTTPTVLKKSKNTAYDNKATKEVQVWSLQELIQNVLTNQVNPDPITQRPQVPDVNKPKKIIEALINDGTFGAGIILRDIRNDEEAQKLYPKVSYLVIDGGHRTRSLVKFYQNELVVKDVDGNNVSITDKDIVNLNLDEEHISVTIYTCTSEQARDIFRSVNKVTQTNFMEDVMADEISMPCRKTREFVRQYSEYSNQPHKVFSFIKNKSNNDVPVYFDGDVNPRNKWMEYVMMAIIKASTRFKISNPSAGEQEILELSKQEEVSKSQLDTVKKFFDDVIKVSDVRQQKFNPKVYGLLQLVWFGLFAENNNFVISDYKKFTHKLMERFVALTDTKKDEVITIENKPQIKTKWFYKNLTSFGTGKTQRQCFNMFMEDVSVEDLGVTFRDANRSISRNDREKELIKQEYKCFIDNDPLTLDDSVWGHDIDWASGGSTLDGKVIRKSHNQRMGQLTIEEYRNTL